MGSGIKAYIGVGTNIGDRIQNLIDAREQLKNSSQAHSLRSSSIYVSSPVGYVDQDDFLNCVFELSIAADNQAACLSDAQLLFSQLQKIELRLGRVRDPNNRNAPRIIDLDMLSFGNLESDEVDLILPHPRIAERLFVLLPILELDSNIALPGLGSLNSLLNEKHLRGDFAGQQIYRLGDRL